MTVQVRPARERLDTALGDAVEKFNRGDMKLGVASLNHALWIALTAQPVLSEGEALSRYRQIERVARVWEQEL